MRSVATCNTKGRPKGFDTETAEVPGVDKRNVNKAASSCPIPQNPEVSRLMPQSLHLTFRSAGRIEHPILAVCAGRHAMPDKAEDRPVWDVEAYDRSRSQLLKLKSGLPREGFESLAKEVI